MSDPIELRRTTIGPDGRRLGFVEAGSGETMVLLPPGASSAAAWRGVVAALDGRFRTLAVNPSGYEETEPFPEGRPVTIDDEADAVMSVIGDAPDPVHLVGHSYGGALALRLALRRRARFRTLTLIEPAAYPLLRESGDDDLADEVEAVNRRFVEHVRSGGEPAPALEAYIDYYNDAVGTWRRLPESARERFVSLIHTVATGLAAAGASPTRLAECGALDVPALLVRGERTDPVHARVADLLAATVPGARREVVAGAGHMLVLSHPEAVAALVAGHASESP